MVEITFDDSFKRAFKKRFQGKHELKRRFRAKLEKFQENPFDPSLKTHKLSGRLRELWSFSIEYDQRVIFYFTDDGKVVFVDIGNHDQVY